MCAQIVCVWLLLCECVRDCVLEVIVRRVWMCTWLCTGSDCVARVNVYVTVYRKWLYLDTEYQRERKYWLRRFDIVITSSGRLIRRLNPEERLVVLRHVMSHRSRSRWLTRLFILVNHLVAPECSTSRSARRVWDIVNYTTCWRVSQKKHANYVALWLWCYQTKCDNGFDKETV